MVELDGSQHFYEKGMIYDSNRSSELEKYGITVLRFTNLEIDRNFTGVCITIDEMVKKRIEA